jgi:hypothetical protein
VNKQAGLITGFFMSINDDELDISRIHPAELHSRVRALGMDCMPRMPLVKEELSSSRAPAL